MLPSHLKSLAEDIVKNNSPEEVKKLITKMAKEQNQEGVLMLMEDQEAYDKFKVLINTPIDEITA